MKLSSISKGIYFIVIFLIVMPFIAFGQTQFESLEKKILNKIDSIRNGKSIYADISFDSTNEEHFLVFLKKIDKDNATNVRTYIHMLKSKLALFSKDSLLRRQIVEDYLDDCYDTDDIIWSSALNRLNYFKERDFSEKARLKMTEIFQKIQLNNEFIMICGTAQVKQLVPQLKVIATSFDRTKEGCFTTNAWYACLALARLGDKEKIDQIIAAIELELDANLRLGKLLKFAAYTRQPGCIKLLRKYLESNEHLPGRVQDGPDKGPAYYVFALEYLAQYIDGFPIKPKGMGFPYSKEEIDMAKEFLKKMNPK